MVKSDTSASRSAIVRRVEPGDWQILRRVRLRMLADAPSAFITTLDQAEAHPDSVWVERAQIGSRGDDQGTYLGLAGDDPVAMGIGLRRDQRGTDVLVIVSVFVAGPWRGTGLAVDLMSEIEHWGMAWGAPVSSLWVAESNDRARVFYDRCGYSPTGDRTRMGRGSERWEIRLEKRLAD